MSRGECIACSDCTCHTAVLSSVKGMQQLLVMTACAMFTCLVMAACAMFSMLPENPKTKERESCECERMLSPNVFFCPEGIVPKFPICRNVAD